MSAPDQESKPPLRVMTDSDYGVEILRYADTGMFWIIFVADDHVEVARQIVRQYYPDTPKGLYECTLAPQLKAVLLFCAVARMPPSAFHLLLNTPPCLCPSATPELLVPGEVIILATPQHSNFIRRAVRPVLVRAAESRGK